MSLAIDLLLCVICGGENDTNGCHLAGFSEDVAFDDTEQWVTLLESPEHVF